MNWKHLEDYLRGDDRAVVPLGCTEQHAWLSLATDSILAERVSLEAAEPLGVPVFPGVPYGVTPGFLDYPGTVSLRLETYLRLIRDLLESLFHQGFRRVLLVNGHGGNSPIKTFLLEEMRGRDVQVKLHDWWSAPRTAAAVRAVDPVASHASWMESFPWTRLSPDGSPHDAKAPIDPGRFERLHPDRVRHFVGDGNFGGAYRKPDEAMLGIWSIAVEETRDRLEDWE